MARVGVKKRWLTSLRAETLLSMAAWLRTATVGECLSPELRAMLADPVADSEKCYVILWRSVLRVVPSVL